MINVLFFGQLRELLAVDNVVMDASSVGTIGELRAEIINQHPEWEKHLSSAKNLVAVNQDMAQNETSIRDGDEVAFFPPVTGG